MLGRAVPRRRPVVRERGSRSRAGVGPGSARHRMWHRSRPRGAACGSRRVGHRRRARRHARDARRRTTGRTAVVFRPRARRRTAAAVRLGLDRCRLRGRAAAPPAGSDDRSHRARSCRPPRRSARAVPSDRTHGISRVGTATSCATTCCSIHECCRRNYGPPDGSASESLTIPTVTSRSRCARAGHSTRSALDRAFRCRAPAISAPRSEAREPERAAIRSENGRPRVRFSRAGARPRCRATRRPSRSARGRGSSCGGGR